MLLFDLGFSSPTALARAQEAARRFVRDTVKPGDLVAVGSISPEHGFRLLTAFTTDRDLVAAALAEPQSFRSHDPLQLANATQLFEPFTSDGPPEVPGRPIIGFVATSLNPYSLSAVGRILCARTNRAAIQAASPGGNS